MIGMVLLRGQNFVSEAELPQIAISHKMFATTEELKNPAIFSLAEETDDKVGRIRFGNATNWLIVGWDTSPNTGIPGLVVYSENGLISKCQFQTSRNNQSYEAPAETGYGNAATTQTVYANHYGASNLNAQLNALFEGSDLFTDKEKSYTLPSTITTLDIKNNIYYTITGTLYTPLSLGNVYGPDVIKIAVGETDNLVIDRRNWVSNYSWTRSPGDNHSDYVLGASRGSSVGYFSVRDNDAAAGVFKLNMDSVIFASAASALQSAEKFSPIANNTGMGLRLNGSTELAGANVTANGAKLTYTAPANSRLMVIAATEDGSTYQFSKSIDAAVTNANFNLVSVAGDLLNKTAVARAWIEKDFSGQLTYATEPISFSAEFTLPTPPREFFKCSSTSPLKKEYDGQKYELIVTSDVPGVGKITVNYLKVNEDGTTTPLTEAPTSPGKYRATFDVEQGTIYGAVKGYPVCIVPPPPESN